MQDNHRRPALRTLAVLGLTLPLHGLAYAAPAAPREDTAPGQAPDDGEIVDAVEREFLHDHAVPSTFIDVSATDGVLTLSGSVSNILARDRAVRIAETVRGVRAIVERIEVDPPASAEDEVVEAGIEAALLEDPAADSYEVTVSVREGRATLQGEVDSWLERRLCEDLAKGVSGVVEVDNRIAISYEGERSDAEIEAEIEEALRWNSLVDHALVRVDVTEGVVSLSGTVGSLAEKRQVRYDSWARGVTDVDASGLEVARWARNEDLRRGKYSPHTPQELRLAVAAALRVDPRVSSFDVDPEMDGSRVELRGVVDNLRARRAAEEDARNTVGVTGVDNYLKVRPLEDRDDEEVADELRAALVRDPYVERERVDVRVLHGVAYLTGELDSRFEKGQADDIASRTDGVVDVVNTIAVDDPTPYDFDPWVEPRLTYLRDWYRYEPTYSFAEDREIAEDIREELLWSPFVDRDDVEVTVVDGIATLTGRVGSAMERSAARDNAYEGGATFVRNELVIDLSD